MMKEARKSYAKRNTDTNEKILKESKQTFDDARKREYLKKTKYLNSVVRLKSWKEFNKLFIKKIDNGIEPLENENGNILTEEKDIEECMFSTFFEGNHLKDADFDDNFYNETNHIYDEIMADRVQYENDHVRELNAQLTMEEIRIETDNYKASGKSSDKEKFNPKMFKHLGERALKQILRLGNICLNEGKWIWNKSWKRKLRGITGMGFTFPNSTYCF